MNDNITIPRPIASAFKKIAAFFILPAGKEEKGRDAEYKSRKEKNGERNSFKGKGNRKSRTAGKRSMLPAGVVVIKAEQVIPCTRSVPGRKREKDLFSWTCTDS